MNCLYCSKKIDKKNVTYNVNRDGYDIIVHDVPAMVCQSCGEVFYAEESVKLIQEMIEKVDQTSEKVRATDLDKYPFVYANK